MNTTESLGMKVFCLKVIYQNNPTDVFQRQSIVSEPFCGLHSYQIAEYRSIYCITEHFYATTSDLFSFYFPVRPKAGGSPAPGENLLSLPLAYNLGHTGLLMEGSRGGW